MQESGPDHEKTFDAQVVLAGVVRGTGSGRSKKAAEQQAAAQAHTALTTDSARTVASERTDEG